MKDVKLLVNKIIKKYPKCFLKVGVQDIKYHHQTKKKNWWFCNFKAVPVQESWVYEDELTKGRLITILKKILEG